MSSQLLDVWQAAARSPYSPPVGKQQQFIVGAALLLLAFVLAGVFSLNRSFTNLPLLGVPASLAFGFGAVYMICAVGVYVVRNKIEPTSRTCPNFVLQYHLLLSATSIVVRGSSDPEMENGQTPILVAVSSSVRQLYLLLRCIAFAPKTHVHIGEDGIKFSVDDASVVEASAFLDKSLFTTYDFRSPALQENSQESETLESNDETPAVSAFQVSLPALLETLQIFGLTDPSASKLSWARDNPYPTSTAFSNNILGMNNLCRISYEHTGAPLSVILTEASIRTTCDLTTYEADFSDEIPFDRQNLSFKTIMQGSWLHDAIQELSSTSPDKLTMYAKMSQGNPYFALASSGTLGSARVEFNKDSQGSAFRTPAASNQVAHQQPGEQAPSSVLETFQLSDARGVFKSTYKFSLIQKAARAMSAATKVSIRTDIQDVLSLQFMIPIEGGVQGGTESARVSFIDFRFIPLVDEGDDEEGANETIMQDRNDLGSDLDEDGNS